MTKSEQTYGLNETGEFGDVPVENMQGGDIIPSHDGLYHMYEGHVENADGTVTVNYTRCRSLEGVGGVPYSVEYPAGHLIPVLIY